MRIGTLMLVLAACHRGPEGDGEPGPAPEVADPGAMPLHRLNNTEYRNTLRDLLYSDHRLSAELPPDPVDHGFDNVAALLSVSPLLVEQYEAAATEMLEDVFEVKDELTTDFVVQAEGPGTYYEGGMAVDATMYALTTEGAIHAPFTLVDGGNYTFTVRAWARQSGDENVRMRVLVDGVEQQTFEVTAGTPGADHTVALEADAGVHTVTLELANALPDEDRVLVVDRVSAHGPTDPEVGFTTGYQELVGPCQFGGCVDDALEAFGARAWRRPLTEDDRTWIRTSYDDALALGLSPDDAFQTAFKAVLLSPDFVFRFEADPVGAAPRTLDAWELASRLSYFLWSSMPDDALFAAAEDGSLLDDAVLQDQVARMMRDDKAAALVDSFAAQWLQTRKVDTVSPFAANYPDFDEPLRRAMRGEMRLHAWDPLLLGAPIDQLFLGHDTWVDARLAEHYGVPFDPLGDTWQAVPLPEGRRGFLTTAGWLAAQSHPDRPSVVQRGKWVTENLLCQEVPPPPPNVEGAVVVVPDAGSVREQEEAQRMTEGSTCLGCHAQMDPFGHALGGFDGIGAARDTDELGFPVETTVTLPTGETVSSIVDALDVISADARFAACVADKTFRYALGRDIRAQDAPFLADYGLALAESGLLFEAVVTEIVMSAPFRMKGALVEESR